MEDVLTLFADMRDVGDVTVPVYMFFTFFKFLKLSLWVKYFLFFEVLGLPTFSD